MAKTMLVADITARPKGNYLSDSPLTDAEMEELTSSIRKGGINVPLLVQKKTGVLIDGFNRLAIAKKLKIQEVPVEVLDCRDEDIEAKQLELQVGRRNLNQAQRKMYVGRLIVLGKLRAEDEAIHGMKKPAAKHAAKVAEAVELSGGKLKQKDVEKVLRTEGGSKAVKNIAKEVAEAPEEEKEVVAKKGVEKQVKQAKTTKTPQQLLEPSLKKIEEIYDEFPDFQKDFKKLVKSLLDSL